MNKNVTQGRIEWVDSYKGILMLLVVFHHIMNTVYLGNNWWGEIFTEPFKSLRMPAFFFISGFLLSKKYDNFSYFFKHRSRQIVLPYFIFFMLNYLVWLLFTRHYTPSDLTLLDPFYGLLKGTTERTDGGALYMLTASPLWFVTTLFIAEIYFFTIKTFFKNNIQILGVLVLFSLAGFFSNYLFHTLDIRPWWNMNVALTAAVFYGLGYLVKTNNLINKINVKNPYLRLLTMTLLLAISFSLSMINTVSMSTNGLGNPILFYIAAFSGIFGMVLFVKLKFVQHNRFFEYLGKNTYLILAFHILAIYFANDLIVYIAEIPKETYTHSLIWTIVYMIVMMMLMKIIIEFFNRYLPFILKSKKTLQKN